MGHGNEPIQPTGMPPDTGKTRPPRQGMPAGTCVGRTRHLERTCVWRRTSSTLRRPREHTRDQPAWTTPTRKDPDPPLPQSRTVPNNHPQDRSSTPAAASTRDRSRRNAHLGASVSCRIVGVNATGGLFQVCFQVEPATYVLRTGRVPAARGASVGRTNPDRRSPVGAGDLRLLSCCG